MRTTYCTATLTVNNTVYSWTKSEIKTASITEEVDPSCMTLPINEATVCIIDATKEFDITNPDGAWNDLEYDQPLVLTETVDGETVDCGTFYLDGWKYASNLATFTAVDAIGYLARRTFPGIFYSNATAASILADIMYYGEYDYFSLDDDLSSVTLSGFLPSSDCREALRCLCLALGAVADCRRSATISITTVQSSHSENIGTDRKFYGNTSAELDEAVATLSFSVPIYVAGTEEETLFSETLPAGTNTISLDPFDEDSISVTGDYVSAYALAGCEITVKTTAAGTVTITGIKYTATTTAFSATTTVENFSDFPETKTYTCPLYNLSAMQSVMADLLEYWQLRKAVKIKYLLTDEISGDWVNVVDEDAQASTIRIESQTIDLAGGFIATAQCKGYTGDVFDTLFSSGDDGSGDDDGDDTNGGSTGGTDDGDDTNGGSTGGTDDGDDTGDGGTTGGTDDGDDTNGGSTGGTDGGDDGDTTVSTLSLGVYCDAVDDTDDGVNFYDNDGRCVYALSWDDVNNLTALPDEPMFTIPTDMTEDGTADLVPTIYVDGWNWDLESLQNLASTILAERAAGTGYADDTLLDVGCCYRPAEDGVCYFIFSASTEAYIPCRSTSSGCSIDWGDGSDAEELSTGTTAGLSHTYDTEGDYLVTLYTGNEKTILGGSSSRKFSTNVIFALVSGAVNSDIVDTYCFKGATGLRHFYADLSADLSADSSFYNCTALQRITFGTGTAQPGYYSFWSCTALVQALFSSNTTTGMTCYVTGQNYSAFYKAPITRISLDMQGTAATFGYIYTDAVYLYGTTSTSENYELSFYGCRATKISGFYWVITFTSPAYAIQALYCSRLTDLVNVRTISADVDFEYATGLTYESALNVLDALSSGSSCTVTFAADTYALLSEDDLAIATDKGWTVASA